MDHKKRHNNKQKRWNSSIKANNKLIQPIQSGSSLDNIPINEDTGEDFETLMNAPISEGGHFVFKFEKDWTIDVPQYSEYFTLDLKILSEAINCIPFNKCIDVDDKYFTIDQLTHMQNNTELAKKNYDKLLNSINISPNLDSDNKDQHDTEYMKETAGFIDLADGIRQINVHKNNADTDIGENDSGDELDFLLSLKEPTSQNVMSVPTTAPIEHFQDVTVQLKPNITTEPEDLEKWLDALIDN